MRKFISFLFFGHLSKHHAGQRPLTNKERRALIVMIYSLAAQVAYYQWRTIKAEEQVQMPAREDFAHIRKDLQKDLSKNSLSNPIKVMAVREWDRANIPASSKNIERFFNEELTDVQQKAFGSADEFRKAITTINI